MVDASAWPLMRGGVGMGSPGDSSGRHEVVGSDFIWRRGRGL